LDPGATKGVETGMAPGYKPFDLAQGGEHVEPHVDQIFHDLVL